MKTCNLLENTSALQLWSSWQKTISEITGMAIGMVDYRGMPITVQEGSCEFCKLIRNDSTFGKYCQKCDALGSLEAVMAEKPCVYKCHFSLVDVAVPIVKDNQYFGSVIAGQVRLENSEDTEQLMQLLQVKKSEIEKKKKELQSYYDKIPVISQKQLENAVSVISNCSESFIQKGESHAEEDALAETQITNKIIAKAVDYIYSLQSKKVSLADVAEHCHVSVSYLSRLFTKELGESYSEFVAKLKITWAKEMLQKTDKTITEISDELGYGEPGYFIKIFKRYAKETPLCYRTSYKNNIIMNRKSR